MSAKVSKYGKGQEVRWEKGNCQLVRSHSNNPGALTLILGLSGHFAHTALH